MSEYQYYEFLAIDKPLTEAQVQAVRKYSSRADISATRFVNEYHFGDFRGDVKEFLTRYFDVMVYVANWGTHRFMFRVPREAVDLAAAKAYCPGDGATIIAAGDHLIFDLRSEDEEGGDWEEGGGFMASLAPVREELIGGDTRPLYLAWLSAVRAGEVNEEDPEPPVPPGLGHLSGPQKALAEFLRVGKELLAVASRRSGIRPRAEEGLGEWIAALPAAEKDAMLLALCEGRQPHLGRTLQRRFREATAAQRAAAPAEPPRTAGELRQSAEELKEEHRREAARQREREQAKARAKEEAERARRLAKLAGRQAEAWAEVERLIGERKAEAYDQAVGLLRDLRDVAADAGGPERQDEFRRRLVELRARHASKRALCQKMTSAGLSGR